MKYIDHAASDTQKENVLVQSQSDQSPSKPTIRSTFNLSGPKVFINELLKIEEDNTSQIDVNDSILDKTDVENDNVILSNIYGLFDCISRRLDDKSMEIYERLLFLLNVGKVEDAKDILRFRMTKSGRNVEKWCKNERTRSNMVEMRALVDETRMRYGECGTLIVKTCEEMKRRGKRIEEMGRIIDLVCKQFGIEYNDLWQKIPVLGEEYGTLKQKARVDFDDRNKILTQENERLKDALAALKLENTKTRNELVILSNEFYKSKEISKRRTDTLTKQKRIIDILQEKLTLSGRETNYTIIDDLKFRIALLQSRIDAETDGDKKKKLLDNLIDYEKRLSDFMSVDKCDE